jgi:hypothetical protein
LLVSLDAIHERQFVNLYSLRLVSSEAISDGGIIVSSYALPLILTTLTLATGASAQIPATTANSTEVQSTPPAAGALIKTPPPAALSNEKIPAGSRVYIAAINGYEHFLAGAFVKKGTPVIIVNDSEKADYAITGVSESVQAGWAKMIFLSSQQSNEQASIVMTNLKTGTVVWGYNVNKVNSYKGKQSSSEACAKHLKARIEGRE